MKYPIQKRLKLQEGDEHPLFNVRRFEVIFEWSKRKWDLIEYQCPVCKSWFAHHGFGGNAFGLKLHISRVGKIEVVAKALNELKKTPHFDFWKVNTQPINALCRPREWKI